MRATSGTAAGPVRPRRWPSAGWGLCVPDYPRAWRPPRLPAGQNSINRNLPRAPPAKRAKARRGRDNLWRCLISRRETDVATVTQRGAGLAATASGRDRRNARASSGREVGEYNSVRYHSAWYCAVCCWSNFGDGCDSARHRRMRIWCADNEGTLSFYWPSRQKPLTNP